MAFASSGVSLANCGALYFFFRPDSESGVELLGSAGSLRMSFCSVLNDSPYGPPANLDYAVVLISEHCSGFQPVALEIFSPKKGAGHARWFERLVTELVYIGSSRFVCLFHLDGIPIVRERKVFFTGLLWPVGRGQRLRCTDACCGLADAWAHAYLIHPGRTPRRARNSASCAASDTFGSWRLNRD